MQGDVAFDGTLGSEDIALSRSNISHSCKRLEVLLQRGYGF
jgi:hypothetical protein